MRWWVIVVLGCVTPGAGASASNPSRDGQEQGPRTFHVDPVVRIVVRNFGWTTYAKQLRKRQQPPGVIGVSLYDWGLHSFHANVEQYVPAAVDCDFAGSCVFVTRGRIPEFERVAFRALKDTNEFRQIVKQRQQSMPAAVLEGGGDCYALLPRQPDGSANGEDVEVLGLVLHEGMMHLETSVRRALYLRRSNGVLFESHFPELLTMELPDLRRVRAARPERASVELNVELEHLSRRSRDAFAAFLAESVAPGLQRRDDEPATRYAFRRALSELLTGQLTSLVTDLESVRGSIEQASDQRIRASLNLAARRGSGLAKTLSELRTVDGRLTGAQPPDVPFAARAAVHLPDSVSAVLHAGLGVLQDGLADPGATGIHGQRLLELISQGLDSRLVFSLSARGDARRGLRFLGAVRLQNAEEIAEALTHLAQSRETEFRVTTTRRDVATIVSATRTPQPGGRWQRYAPQNLSFAAAGSTLWMAAGDDSSVDDIAAAMAATGERSPDADPAIASLQWDLGQLAGTDQPASGFSHLPGILVGRLQSAMALPSRRIVEVSYFRSAFAAEHLEPVPVRRTGVLDVEVEANAAGLRFRAELDQPTADYFGLGLIGAGQSFQVRNLQQLNAVPFEPKGPQPAMP